MWEVLCDIWAPVSQQLTWTGISHETPVDPGPSGPLPGRQVTGSGPGEGEALGWAVRPAGPQQRWTHRHRGAAQRPGRARAFHGLPGEGETPAAHTWLLIEYCVWGENLYWIKVNKYSRWYLDESVNSRFFTSCWLINQSNQSKSHGLTRVVLYTLQFALYAFTVCSLLYLSASLHLSSCCQYLILFYFYWYKVASLLCATAQRVFESPPGHK